MLDVILVEFEWLSAFPDVPYTERVHSPYQTGSGVNVNGEALPYPVESDRSANSYYNPDTRRYG